MAEVQVLDVMIWSKHIRGDDKLVWAIESSQAGEVFQLVVDGRTGQWKKAKNDPETPTGHGLIPKDEAATHWRRLFNERRGEFVSVVG